MYLSTLITIVALLLGSSTPAMAQHSSEAIAATITFNAPFNQDTVSGCESGTKITGKAFSPVFANLVITTTPVVISSASMDSEEVLTGDYTGFTGEIDFEEPVSQVFPDQQLGILVSATMWDINSSVLASKKALIVPCKIHLPFVTN